VAYPPNVCGCSREKLEGILAYPSLSTLKPSPSRKEHLDVEGTGKRRL